MTEIAGDEPEKLTAIIIANICEELAKRNWTLKMLADKSDLPYESVKKLVNLKIGRPSFMSIWQISNAFGCSLDSLVGRDDPSGNILNRVSESTSEIYRILRDMDKLSQSSL